MTVTLPGFDIANGNGRTYQLLDTESFDLQQETQVEMPSRAAWPVAFWSRASRVISLEYPVTFPPCDTVEDAVMQARTVAITCPKGGVLIEYHAGVRHTYADSWVENIKVTRIGVTNLFRFSLRAVNPTSVSLILDSDGEIFTDGEDDEEFTY
jgi:hypothetical protein